jgi:glycosyltransferase involved in cell wall biosynthesis
MSAWPSKLRILTVVLDLEKGGTQRAAQVFAEAYASLGHDSRVLAMEATGPRARELEQSRIPVWDGRDSDAIHVAAAWAPDVIHLHSLRLEPEFVSVLVRACGAKSVIETSVFSVPSPWEDLLDTSFQLGTWCEWLYARRGGNPKKSAIVPYPVDERGFFRAPPEDAGAFRQRWGIAPGDILILRVGQAYPGKWSPLLLDAFAELVSGGEQAKLMLVNAPNELLKLADTSPHRERICVVDQIIGDAGLRVAYSAADIFAHVADQGESFGMVLAEAMLCNTPVVTMSTPWGDNTQTEVVGNMRGGLVTTSRRGFVEALRALARDPSLRKSLGEGARSRVLERYSALAVAEQAIALARDRRRSTSDGQVRDAGAWAADRQAILRVYSDAFDPPRALLRASIGRVGRLQLPRYLSGYQPWNRLGKVVLHSCGARLGLCQRLGGWWDAASP